MKKIINQILQLGVKEDQPKYLSSKIYISNLISLAVAFIIAIPYIGISYIFYPPLIFIPAVAVVVCAFSIFLNYIGQIFIGRLIIGLLPMFMAVTYVAYIIPPNGIKHFEFYIVGIAFSLIPFLVFDIREKAALIGNGILVIFIFLFALDWFNATLNKDLDPKHITEGILGQVNLFLGVSLIIIEVTVFSLQNFKFQKEAEKLINQMDDQAEFVKASENELKNKISEIEESQVEEKKRNWATHGIAEISTLLRSDQNGEKLYDKITGYLTEYLDANQCGLFLLEKDEHNDNEMLKLQSCYAFNRKKFIEKEISPGQGLVGQAYLEKASIYLNDVPVGYTEITSGLGDNTPKEVLIVPLIVNENVEGVLEFASFKHFEKYQIDFLEHLGETLASFININRINEQTKILLDETQEQAEQMRSQEEEMRQNMEELSATQEEMARKEQEYLVLIENLKKKVEQAKNSGTVA